jgi:hypothetical protein
MGAATISATDTMDTSRATPGPGVPWYLWCPGLAVTSAYVGG